MFCVFGQDTVDFGKFMHNNLYYSAVLLRRIESLIRLNVIWNSYTYTKTVVRLYVGERWVDIDLAASRLRAAASYPIWRTKFRSHMSLSFKASPSFLLLLLLLFVLLCFVLFFASIPRMNATTLRGRWHELGWLASRGLGTTVKHQKSNLKPANRDRVIAMPRSRQPGWTFSM